MAATNKLQKNRTISQAPAKPVQAQTGIKQESPLYAEPIFQIGKLTVTNSLINSWIAVIIIVSAILVMSRKIKMVPRGLQNVFEILLEEALTLADSITGSRKKSEKFLPIVLTLFIFILINNWMGILPGVGTIGLVKAEGGSRVFVPFFRGGNADLNTTLSMALFTVIAAHLLGIVAVGVWQYFNKFINVKAFAEIPGKVAKDFTIILVNPIKAFVGLIELIGEIAKVISLSFRLFGNVFAGEVLLASMMAIFAYLLPLPFIFLEILVGLIQALIFAMLALVYMSIATEKEEH